MYEIDFYVIGGWHNTQAFQKVQDVYGFEVSYLSVSGHGQTVHGSYSDLPIKGYFWTCT